MNSNVDGTDDSGVAFKLYKNLGDGTINHTQSIATLSESTEVPIRSGNFIISVEAPPVSAWARAIVRCVED